MSRGKEPAISSFYFACQMAAIGDSLGGSPNEALREGGGFHLILKTQVALRLDEARA